MSNHSSAYNHSSTNLLTYVEKQKLIWRSTRRAMLEVDLFFTNFLEQVGLDNLTDEEIVAYSDLVECNDWDLLILFQGKDHVVDNIVAQCVVDKIRACSKL